MKQWLVPLIIVVAVFYLDIARQLKAKAHIAIPMRLLPVAHEQLRARFRDLIDPLLMTIRTLGFGVLGYLDGPGNPTNPTGIRLTVLLRSGDGTVGAAVYVSESARGGEPAVLRRVPNLPPLP
jgi:hypothetical protein